MLTGPYNATRHAQKPLHQPNYNFNHVPKANPNLKGSHIVALDTREQFQVAMAEMLLLCKEAMRRSKQQPPKSCSSKPLSLEYLADRLDIDDPCFGYCIRTHERVGRRSPDFLPGMLQGFITVTTFTNWQESFRWDSQHPAAYEFDDSTVRVRDPSGALARELQSTIRCGDIHQEGIVWPRIAEISLLGALGAGKTLIKLVVEHLEGLKATTKANYDYVVLQATDNSIPFYESMGFVRVGAVMMEDSQPKNSFVASKYKTYTVKKAESISSIAAKENVDVWDLLFLNQHVIGDEAKPSSKPLLETVLLIPQPEDPIEHSAEGDVVWHTAKENETPKMIAKIYDVKVSDVVKANKGKLEGLAGTSRLRQGTKVKVSHFHIQHDMKAYAHWSFPDKIYEEPEPSYMMALKLNRRKANDRKNRPFLESLETTIQPYEQPPLLLPPSPVKKRAQQGNLGPEPVPPKRPPSAYALFSSEQRQLDDAEASNYFEMKQLWSNLSKDVKAEYEVSAHEAMSEYQQSYMKYEEDMAIYRGDIIPEGEEHIKFSLYNKVVRLKEGAMTEGSDYKYWYVLTYIPDLKWCHLAPMVEDGVFGDKYPKAKGRSKWKLVDETLGHEVDISSSFCIPIKTKSMKKTLDADKEEWDVIDDGTDPTMMPSTTPRMVGRPPASLRGTSAKKPAAERVRKTRVETPSLLATLPGSGTLTTVKLRGKNIFDNIDSPRKRGRPKGSKDTVPRRRKSEPANPTGRRKSVVNFNIPASARKASAIRVANGKRKSVASSSRVAKRQRIDNVDESDEGYEIALDPRSTFTRRTCTTTDHSFGDKYWFDPNWIPCYDNGEQKTPRDIRRELEDFLRDTDFTTSRILRALGVNSNSWRKFMVRKYKDDWRGTENGAYWAGARMLEAMAHDPNASMSPNTYKIQRPPDAPLRVEGTVLVARPKYSRSPRKKLSRSPSRPKPPPSPARTVRSRNASSAKAVKRFTDSPVRPVRNRKQTQMYTNDPLSGGSPSPPRSAQRRSERGPSSPDRPVRERKQRQFYSDDLLSGCSPFSGSHAKTETVSTPERPTRKRRQTQLYSDDPLSGCSPLPSRLHTGTPEIVSSPDRQPRDRKPTQLYDPLFGGSFSPLRRPTNKSSGLTRSPIKNPDSLQENPVLSPTRPVRNRKPVQMYARDPLSGANSSPTRPRRSAAPLLPCDDPPILGDENEKSPPPSRPKRKSAPSFLGESPQTPKRARR